MRIFHVLWAQITKSTERKTATHIQVNEVVIIYITVGTCLGKQGPLNIFSFEYVESVVENSI